MTEVDIVAAKDDQELTKDIKEACEKKLKFRNRMA